MPSGWVFDCHLERTTERMVTWIKLDSGAVIRQTREWRISLHVLAGIERLERLARWLAQPEVQHGFGRLECRFERRCCELGGQRSSTVLAVSTDRPSRLLRLAEAIDGRGGWLRHELFSVDQKLAQRHLADLGTYPFGRVRIDGRNLIPLDERSQLDWPLPPLRILHLHTDCRDEHGQRTARAPLRTITLTPGARLGVDEEAGPARIIEARHGGEEEACASEACEMLDALHCSMEEFDPDVLVTEAGDRIDLPALRRLARRAGRELRLGRSEHDGTPRSRARTAWSYGKMLRKEAYHALEGRLHIDMSGSFIVREGGIEGLLELARLAGLSAQDLSRLSPGSAISAMQMRQAMEDGVLVPWKKNRPEDVKSGLELLAADRGGLYLEPKVGVHRRVVELDFASLFPSIIATRNISPETLGCSCCDPGTVEGRVGDVDGDGAGHNGGDDDGCGGGEVGDGRLPLGVEEAAMEVARRISASEGELLLAVPELSLHCCTRRHGFLGRVVAPIIERRRSLKAQRVEKGDMFDRRQNALKWVLVTCFGYTGYRNARFGRIECHEAICAWARQILLQAIEVARDEGWDCLHAIVDSMWLSDMRERDNPSRKRSIERIIHRLNSEVGIPIDLEDEYDWIAFLPNRTTGVGALTKYFGYGHGWKVRGIELRQHSTCTWVERLQQGALDLLRDDPGEVSQQKVVEYLHSELARLRSGEIPLRDLVVARRVQRELHHFRAITITFAALTRAARLGRRIPPGHKVRFVVVDRDARDIGSRVRLQVEVESESAACRDVRGEVRFYEPLAVRSIWAVLSPFGWDESGILRASRSPLTLTAFSAFDVKSSSDA